MFTVYTGTGVTAITGTYIDTTVTNTNTNPHRHDHTLDTAYSGRRLVFAISWKGNNSRTLSTATLDEFGINVACTIHLNQANTGTSPGCAIISVEEATLTGLHELKLTFSGLTGTGSRISSSLYSLTSCTASNGNTAMAANTSTSTVNATYGSYVVSVCMAYNITGTVAWTGATEDNEQSVDGASYKHVVAHESMTATDATYDTVVTASTSATYMRIGTYVFAPT